MTLDRIGPGPAPPWDVHVVVEIPQGSPPIKYEFDPATGALHVDRFLHTAMTYPGNYGFVPGTLAPDGDPCDALVLGAPPLAHGCVVRVRPVGALMVEDEKGRDEKILAVPVDSLRPFYAGVRTWRDLPEALTDQVGHFFTRYKELEPGKVVDITRWADADEAAALIEEGLARAAGGG
jgi:inorganic pyrophosphatase